MLPISGNSGPRREQLQEPTRVVAVKASTASALPASVLPLSPPTWNDRTPAASTPGRTRKARAVRCRVAASTGRFAGLTFACLMRSVAFSASQVAQIASLAAASVVASATSSLFRARLKFAPAPCPARPLRAGLPTVVGTHALAWVPTTRVVSRVGRGWRRRGARSCAR